jgi:hypothetical protein
MRYFPPPVDAFLGAENFVFRVCDVMATITLPTLEQALFGLFTITNIINNWNGRVFRGYIPFVSLQGTVR